MAIEAAHYDGRRPAVLPAHEIGSCRDLIGDSDERCAQLAAIGVAPTPPVVQRL
ncbi:MAG TPA: hypothetical protein VFN85_03510 [Solirubrobacterales bacterium]|nr:hypothetical protein [Solirubrobacterales bacterium]